MLFRLFGGDASTVVQTLIARVIVLMTAIPVHEYAHAWAAEKMGDSTARYYKRLSLNPLDHIDPIGALMILLFGVGFARPVPVNSANFRSRTAGIVVSSLAGPASNIIMALLSMIAAKLIIIAYAFSGIGFLAGVFRVFIFMVSINLSLAVFNLLPIPPLDGWHALCPLLPREVYWRIQPYEQQIVWVLLLCVWLGALDGVIGTLVSLLYSLLDAVTFFL